MELTFGLELEWADVDKRIPIPDYLGKWNWDDFTIVNSDGHANDPTGKTWVYGSEINTRPTTMIDEQVSAVKQLADLLNPATTYTCALHIHIAYKPLVEDIDLLQKFFAYALANEDDFFRVAWKTSPTISTPEEEKAARKYLSARSRRSIGKMPANRIAEIQKATTPTEFYQAHAPLSETTGRRVWHLSPRAGINMKSLFKHGTVEFRCFAGSHDPETIREAMEWCRQFFVHALTDGRPVRDLILPKKVPILPPFDLRLEKRFQETKFKGTTNGRSSLSD